MHEGFIRAGRWLLGYPDEDPCRECGTRWVRPVPASRDTIAEAPDRYVMLLAEGEDQPRDPREWSPVGYTVHLGDWLRIWTERVVAAAVDPEWILASIDPDELGRLREYERTAEAAALHVLTSSVRDTLEVFDRVGVVEFESPDFGVGDSESVLAWLAHEVDHHAWDIARLRGSASIA